MITQKKLFNFVILALNELFSAYNRHLFSPRYLTIDKSKKMFLMKLIKKSKNQRHDE